MAFTKPDVNNPWGATGGGIIEPASAKINQGWVAEIPDFEFENWIQNRQDQFNAHINQYGIPLWDATTEYQANASYVQGSDGVVYQALTTNTNTDPSGGANSSDWVKAFDAFDSSYSKTEADDRFLNESSNLSDLTNTATARTNLSVYSQTESDARYLLEANNLSDLVSVSTARTNLDVYSKGEADGRYLLESNNLSDLVSASTARTNLGLGSAATRSVGTGTSNLLQTSDADLRYLNESSNLGDLPDTAIARSNLGVISQSDADARYLLETNNLSDLTNAVTARSNLSVYSQIESDGRYLNEDNNLSDLADVPTARTNLDVYSTGQVDQDFQNIASLVGMVAPFAMQSAPSGWLKCNGSAVSRTTYSALFSAIGTLYGNGDGSTTFNLPDLRGEFIRGFDDGRGIDSGRSMGSFQSDAIESHSHTGTTDVDGLHTHTYSSVAYNLDPDGSNVRAGTSTTKTTSPAGEHTHTFTTNNTGGSETRPRNIAMLYCIKA